MLKPTIELLVARFLFSLTTRKLDEDGYRHMREWLEQVVENDLKWEEIEKLLPSFINDVECILNDLDKPNIPWHSPEHQVWPALIRFARMNSGGISV
jgi:hypothetical protein